MCAALGAGGEGAEEEGAAAPATTPIQGVAMSSRTSFEREGEPTQALLVRLVKKSSLSSVLTDEGLAWMMLRAL